MSVMPTLSKTPAFVCALLALACGQSHDPAASPRPIAATAAGGEQPAQRGDTVEPEIDWASAGRDARVMHMTFGVLVDMADLFQSFDSGRYVSFTCTTCHGADMVEVDFKMPNTLYPLDPDNLPSPGSHDPREAAYARFMSDVVTPRMGALLGDKSFAGNDGCFRCHAARL